MMKKLEILFEKYNFDYIVINPKELEYLEWEFIPEELVADFIGTPGYLGKIKLKDKLLDVYYDKKVPFGEILFKFNDIRKERSIKLSELLNITHNSGN